MDLASRIRAEIDRDGPMRADRFMELAHFDPDEGYYSAGRATRAGPTGDFVTAPTLTPYFGSALARFAVAAWERMGEPGAWTIVEAAGGTGALAQGLLTALSRSSAEAMHALEYVLVDVDPRHREDAADALAPWAEQVTITGELPERKGPALVIANELLDDLPVRRLKRRGGKWYELCVHHDGDRFVWVETPASEILVAWVERSDIDVPDGQTLEVPVGASHWLERVTHWSKDRPTLLLLIDYGEVARDLMGEPRPHGTLRAYEGQRTGMDVLEAPGTRNLTTHVDWSSMAHDARDAGWRVSGFTTQSSFLMGLGLLQTAASLGAHVHDETSMAALSALKEVLLPGGMGEDVKVLLLERNVSGRDTLPGFHNPRPVDPPQRRH